MTGYISILEAEAERWRPVHEAAEKQEKEFAYTTLEDQGDRYWNACGATCEAVRKARETETDESQHGSSPLRA